MGGEDSRKGRKTGGSVAALLVLTAFHELNVWLLGEVGNIVHSFVGTFLGVRCHGYWSGLVNVSFVGFEFDAGRTINKVREGGTYSTFL